MCKMDTPRDLPTLGQTSLTTSTAEGKPIRKYQEDLYLNHSNEFSILKWRKWVTDTH